MVEGDEYDDVYWSKQPKFLDYVGIGSDDVAVLTSIEQDHIDIYPSEASYEDAFRAFVRAMPAGGLLVVDARATRARVIAQEESRAKVSFYALEGDETGDVTPTWLGTRSCGARPRAPLRRHFDSDPWPSLTASLSAQARLTRSRSAIWT